jgi:hypothetical protein
VQKLLLRLWKRRVRKRITNDDRPMKIFFFAVGKSFFSIEEKNFLHFDRDRLHFHIHNPTEVIMLDSFIFEVKSCPSHGRVGR